MNKALHPVSTIEKNKIYTVLNNDCSHILLLHDQNDKFCFVHVAWHNDLRNDIIEDADARIQNKSYICLNTFLNFKLDDGASAEAFSAFVDLVLKKNFEKGLPYSFAFTGSFNDQGEWVSDEPIEGKGFTCATFVMMLFSSFGYKIIEHESWIIRDSDIEKEQEIYESLMQNNTDSTHMEAMKNFINVIRIRPEEVSVASAIYKAQKPSDYKYIQTNISTFYENIKKHTAK